MEDDYYSYIFIDKKLKKISKKKTQVQESKPCGRQNSTERRPSYTKTTQIHMSMTHCKPNSPQVYTHAKNNPRLFPD